ncbi:MAG: tetratricopeptide repeat protein [Actinobacteria bacterium]|nr:tetratricopeptide repeat protein [Actinomycetota bacterium]
MRPLLASFLVVVVVLVATNLLWPRPDPGPSGVWELGRIDEITGVASGGGGAAGDDLGGDVAGGDVAGGGPGSTMDPVRREHPEPEMWEELLPRVEEDAKAHPEDAARRLRLALVLYNLDRYEEAEAIYREMLTTGEDAVIRKRLGNVLRDKGDYEGARAAYLEALATDPAAPSLYINLADLLWRWRRTDEALRVLADGMEKVPPDRRPALESAAAAIGAASGSDRPGTTPPVSAP